MSTNIKVLVGGLGLILLISVAGCPKPMPSPNPPGPDATDATPPAPPAPPTPPQTVDAASPTPSVYTCTTVCTNLKNRKCKGANKTVKGSACVDVCQNVQDSGILTWDLKCRSTQTTCAAIDACN
jgi:hypothetical protein